MQGVCDMTPESIIEANTVAFIFALVTVIECAVAAFTILSVISAIKN